ncbi:hypothetical protein HDU92_008466 [Lobulomyces angularis]|nr:hypothetical protein HDU92_008466 [Lobulomyces angularis]
MNNTIDTIIISKFADYDKNSTSNFSFYTDNKDINLSLQYSNITLLSVKNIPRCICYIQIYKCVGELPNGLKEYKVIEAEKGSNPIHGERINYHENGQEFDRMSFSVISNPNWILAYPFCNNSYRYIKI